MYEISDEMWWELEFLENRLEIDFDIPRDGMMPESNEIRGHGSDGAVVIYSATPSRFRKARGQMPRTRTWLEIDNKNYRVSDVVHALSFDDSGQTTGEAIRYGPKDHRSGYVSDVPKWRTH